MRQESQKGLANRTVSWIQIVKCNLLDSDQDFVIFQQGPATFTTKYKSPSDHEPRGEKSNSGLQTIYKNEKSRYAKRRFTYV